MPKKDTLGKQKILIFHSFFKTFIFFNFSYEKKREGDRLKCNVCGENFRERHHLTRHMTAHQDRNEDENRETNLLGRALITPPTTA